MSDTIETQAAPADQEAQRDAALRPSEAFQDPKGRWMWPDTAGNFVPEERIKAEHRIEDEMVRKILGFARDLSAQVARFKSHSFADIEDFQALLSGHYGAKKKGGAKGNVTFFSFDGLMKVEVKSADLTEFGPQLQTAKELIDECLNEWSADARDELKTIVMRAFNVDKEGQVNRAELYRLRTYDIADQRWQQAMQAIADATRVVGSKEYIRFYERADPEGAWRSVSIDLAKA